MRRRSAFVSASFAGLIIAASAHHAEAQACKMDGPTLVCPRGGKTYRVIANTTSPSKRFAIAWLPAKPEDNTVETKDDGTKDNIGEPCDNFIVRLSDGVPVRKTPGTHWGDLKHYNHREKIALWSPNETWLVEIDETKWSSDVVQVYRFGNDGAPNAGFSLLAPLRKAALAYLAGKKKKIDASRFVDSVQVDEIANDGTMTLKFIMQVPKKESYEFETRIAIAPKGDAARIDIRSMEFDPGDQD